MRVFNKDLIVPWQVFSALPDEIPILSQYKFERQLDEVSWSLCKKHYTERDNPIFPDDCVFLLFRIFCMLGELVENEKGKIEASPRTGDFVIKWASDSFRWDGR